MVAGKVRHWKHGWIPISPEAKAIVALRSSKVEAKQARADLLVPAFSSLSPSLQGKIKKKLEQTTGMPEPELAARVQDNMLRLFKEGNKADLEWYPERGRELKTIADRVNQQYGGNLSREQMIGMVSVTSAHKRWQENKDFAEAIARKLAADEPFEVDQTTIDDYNAWATKRRGSGAKPIDLTPGTYRPSQLPADFVASKTPGMPRAINGDAVIKATQIFRGEVPMDSVVGGPKQRSFVNNMVDPTDDRYVTVDTWHYKAMMQGIPLTREFGPKDNRRDYSYTLEQWDDLDLTVTDGRAADYGYDPNLPRYHPANKKATMAAQVTAQEFFQAGPSSVADKWPGKNGTYPWFVEQTQAAAARAGVLPSAFQAVIWTAIGGGE